MPIALFGLEKSLLDLLAQIVDVVLCHQYLDAIVIQSLMVRQSRSVFGVYERGREYKRAQRLNPDDWNYHARTGAARPKKAGKLWLEKFQKLETPYYPKLEIKPDDRKPPPG